MLGREMSCVVSRIWMVGLSSAGEALDGIERMPVPGLVEESLPGQGAPQFEPRPVRVVAGHHGRGGDDAARVGFEPLCRGGGPVESPGRGTGVPGSSSIMASATTTRLAIRPLRRAAHGMQRDRGEDCQGESDQDPEAVVGFPPGHEGAEHVGRVRHRDAVAADRLVCRERHQQPDRGEDAREADHERALGVRTVEAPAIRKSSTERHGQDDGRVPEEVDRFSYVRLATVAEQPRDERVVVRGKQVVAKCRAAELLFRSCERVREACRPQLPRKRCWNQRGGRDCADECVVREPESRRRRRSASSASTEPSTRRTKLVKRPRYENR